MRPPPPRRDKPRPVLTPRGASADVGNQRDSRNREVEDQPSLAASAGTGESPEVSGATPEEPTPQPPQPEESVGASSGQVMNTRICRLTVPLVAVPGWSLMPDCQTWLNSSTDCSNMCRKNTTITPTRCIKAELA